MLAVGQYNSNIEAGDLVRWRLDWFLILSRENLDEVKILNLNTKKIEIINVGYGGIPAETIKGSSL